VRRIKQARLFWQGLQYAWWNPNDMSWHLPYDPSSGADKSAEENAALPVRHKFVSGVLAFLFIALISQDTPRHAFLSAVRAN